MAKVLTPIIKRIQFGKLWLALNDSMLRSDKACKIYCLDRYCPRATRLTRINDIILAFAINNASFSSTVVARVNSKTHYK